jgi:hypothetical protein
MRKSIVLAGIVMAAAVALPAAAQPQGGVLVGTAPGVAGAAATVEVAGTITGLDAQTRLVTLKGDGGKDVAVTAGPEVKNFDRLHVGDRVALQVFKSLTLELKKGSTAVVSRSEETAKVGGEAGQQPGGALGRQVTVMAEVIGVDAENQVVTLKGPNRSVDLEVRDPEQFKLIAVGDRVEATYTEAVAVSISPAKAE